ncbi:MAG TPA: NAD(P)/FAD-dependent oxidoreductase, partial [Gemmatales bacterium]|nr:NAD(P)/FAD-dependent oxidoreductase [Gemmatales bacterium]
AILEARHAIGGTWDLFQYPGIRSDSDMYTLGYPFKPWVAGKAIADGPSILEYIRETAREFGIDKHILYQHRVTRADFSTSTDSWKVEVHLSDGQTRFFTTRFLYLCAGYYDYDAGYTPEFPGRERYRGEIVHPQKWTSDIKYAGKQVVVIGSGATAVTMVPEMAKTAAKVTMLQRTPTYIISLPSVDTTAERLRRWLPGRYAFSINRWKNVLVSMAIYQLAKRSPKTMRWLINKGVKAELGTDFDLKHFTPPYNPWEQRLCVVPDADLFRAIKAGNVELVTDHIETFTEQGIQLRSGREIPADLIVTATGLKLKLMGGMQLEIDGQPVNIPACRVYKGMMLSDVPNMAFAVGYTNASWTLKADLSNQYVSRLVQYMERERYTRCVPRVKGNVQEEPLLDFNSGYVLRDLHTLPKQGSKAPWKLYQNYILDLMTLKYRSVTNSMEFSRLQR